MASNRSLAWPLAAAWACLMVYASLHPFSGWQWPDHLEAHWLVLSAPQPHYVTGFDVASNLLGYVPLGALLGLLAASMLSHAMENLQRGLPGRTPSVIDWMLNGLGAALGVAAWLAAGSLRARGVRGTG
jgi:VanZ family protein